MTPSPETGYNPDVLSCIANLSNDEVFTPPDLANAMLDLLPQELFRDPTTTFLDPACKSGVFLREIAKRLLKGLEPVYPNLQKRVDHIFRCQLFGIAITELTAHLSRRSVYCSKTANSNYSVTQFDTDDGNIRFKNIRHKWEDGKCVFCGASQELFDRDDALEAHAYEMIHTTKSKELFKMRFDVIIGNPPYQLNVGNEGGNASKAKAIYHLFISQAMLLNPRYLCMITPSRWMTKTTEGISNEWVDEMLKSNHFCVIHDYEDSSDCFPGVEIKGGVNYFLYQKDYSGPCKYFFHHSSNNEIISRDDYLDSMNAGIVIRDPNSYSIISKIESIEHDYYKNADHNFSGLVSPKDFFTNKQVLTSSWKGYSSQKTTINNIKYYLNRNIHGVSFGWVNSNVIPKNKESIPLNKVYIPAAGGTGYDEQVLGKPFFGEKNSVCSQTYLVIGFDPQKHNLSEKECHNIISYIHTRFFRFLVSIKKKTQNGPRGVYQFVPLQNFDEEWTDEKLFDKYGLTENEISYIESKIKTMEGVE